MEQKLRILILEDVATDAELIVRELQKEGIVFSSRLVATKEAFLKELKEFIPDLILSDYSLPQFDGLSALAITKEQCPDMPFILISGTIGEEFAIEALKSGATDYVLKHRLSRLVPAVRRALQESKERTERKRAEESLKVSENKYRTLVENLPQKIFLKDRNSTYVSCNENYAHDLKIRPDEITGKTDYDFYPKELAEKYRTDDKRIMGLGNLEDFEERYIQNGKEAWVHTIKTPIKDEKGNVTGILGIFRDITKLKQAQKALEESEKKYRTLFEESKDVIFVSTLDGKFLDINPAGIELFGYSSKEELLNADVDKEIYLHLGYRKRFMEVVDTEGFVRDFEFMMRRKDGEIITVVVTASCIRDNEGNIVACRGIMRDITEQKKLQAQLVHAQKMEAVGQLTGGIAHDFNNILTAIVGYSSLLQMKMSKDDPLRHNADQILASTERAANLVQSLLAFSRKQIISLQPVKINEIVKRVEKLLLRIIGEDIEKRTIIADEDLTVMADSGQIEQVLMNLATNARDAMPDGGSLTVETEIVEIDEEYIKTHGYGEPGMYALISFTDTGEGMDEETKKKIFDPFFTTKEVGKGTGLGLSMVYGIIKQHNGYINVYSELDRGTTFKIYLPLTKKEVKEIKPTEPAPLIIGGTETVLLAEDDTDVRKFTKNILEEFGYKVIDAEDGEDAIQKFMENKDRIQVLLLDVIMPKKNGKEVYEEIKKARPDIKALFMSGYTANVIHDKGILEEGLEFILKPISPTKLLRKIREVLDKD